MTARSEKTKEKIKNAFLVLLAMKHLDAITMSELALVSHVSRSTLYGHYANVREVYDDVVDDFCAGLRPLTTQLRCAECFAETGEARPFCVALRDAGKYEALVKDPSFLPTVLDAVGKDQIQYGEYPLGDEIDDRIARALYRFQMSGCYAVAMDKAVGDDWASVQMVLDAYIRAGVNAARNL